MKNYKENILKLRLEGKSYREIEKILGCSRALVSYYCNPETKSKILAGTKKRRAIDPLIKKIDHFLHDRNLKKKFYAGINNFSGGKVENITFNGKDLIEKFGPNPICYLSGRKLDWSGKKSFALDHIIPKAQGGSNNIENCGITHPQINQCKSNLTPEQFISLCCEIVKYNGYKVKKIIP